MAELAVAELNEPVGKNSYYNFDPETGERVLAGELKRRQAQRAKTNNMANNGPPPENAAHPESNVPNSSLPKGWKKVQLEKNPNVQWYESNTGEEQWFAPGSPNTNTVVLEDEPGLQPGWKRARNSRNKSVPTATWYEHENGRTQWERPSRNNKSNNASVKNNGAKNNGVKNTNVSSALSPTSTNNSLGSLKQQINKLGNTLEEMQTTLTKTGGRRKSRKTRRRKSRKTRRNRSTRK